LPGTFNLLNDAWFPAVRADGRTESIRPADITSAIKSNPVIAIDWPRADFRVACLEFLIGLVATAYPSDLDDDEAWIEVWENPPTPDVLDAAFAPLVHAFNLDGPGPRFLQDFDELPGEPDSPETLLIEAPGENTRRKNRALLVKSDRVMRLSRPAAAMALFTLQCYAPSGGRGNLTSLRGGGPLTTLVLPTLTLDPCPVWHLIWANVPGGKRPAAADLPRIFPWLAPTRTADRFPVTTPHEAHPLQVFWGMPRRIRLEFSGNSDGLSCDLTGAVDPVIVTGWRQRPNGVKYFAWNHPLSAYRKNTNDGSWRAVQPQPGGIGYRNWVAIVVRNAEDTRRPAPCIVDWPARSAEISEPRQARLLAAGYVTDNMKAIAFVESEMPLPGSDPETAAALGAVAQRLVAAADIVARMLRNAVRDAHYRRNVQPKPDSAPLASIYEAFWAVTQDRFFALLNAVDKDWETALKALAPGWRATLRNSALALFDEVAPLDPSLASFDPQRIVEARRRLFFALEGYGSNGNRLFEALLLPLPERKGRKRGEAA
jgi:CRISPR system Cascade subunit CasA